MPTACMKAWSVVGPTKVQPRRRSSFESAIDSGVALTRRSRDQTTRRGRDAGGGSKRHTNAAREPASSRSAHARRALRMADSIFPRCRTIDEPFAHERPS